jgi:cardiolipin hydrolase
MDDLREALKQSLDDERLSRGERKALRALLAERQPDVHERRLLRRHAFDLAADALAGAQATTVLDWLKDAVGLLSPVAAKPATAEVETGAWFSPGAAPLGALIKEMRRARATADVCVFTITDDRISDGLIGLKQRGVRVRVLSDDQKAGDRGSDIGRLRDAGITVALDRSPAHMHHKFCLFDAARLVTGSFNWTRSASGENNENLLLTTEPSLVASFGDEFERLWARWGS